MRINVAVVFVVSFLMLPFNGESQNQFEKRILEIEQKLNLMADSSITGLKDIAQISVADATIQELLRGIAENHYLNISVSPELKILVTNNFTNVTVKNLILFLCRKYQLDIEFIGNILSFKKYDEEVTEIIKTRKLPIIIYEENEGLLSVDLEKDSLSVFVKELSKISGKNVILSPGVEDRLMNGFINKVGFLPGLEKIAYINNLKVEESKENNFYILKEADEITNIITQNENVKTTRKGLTRKKVIPDEDIELNENLVINISEDSLLSIEAFNISTSEIITKAAYTLSKDYIFFSVPEGTSYIKLKQISFSQLLDILFKGTNYTYLVQDNVYLIGNRLKEGFRTTKLIKFQYRPIWEIETHIPAQIIEDVQIIPFDELNALVLSGSENHIAEIEEYLKVIDQPVPNIMINVMVIEVKKTLSTETGITAMFGDSVPNTGGQILSGVDVTIGSNAFNGLLSKLQENSIINLGRVKPNFYMNIKALEQNGNLKVKSTPKLSTLNGHEAIMTIGKSVYYQESTQNVTGGVNPIITTSPRFNKVDANLTIKIKPIISGDDNITLDIEAEFSDFIPPEIENAPPGNATRKFVSQIRVLNEEVILLGGLEQTSNEQLHSGVPLLSRIPILKWIFSTNKTSDTDSRLLILIRPEIVY